MENKKKIFTLRRKLVLFVGILAAITYTASFIFIEYIQPMFFPETNPIVYQQRNYTLTPIQPLLLTLRKQEVLYYLLLKKVILIFLNIFLCNISNPSSFVFDKRQYGSYILSRLHFIQCVNYMAINVVATKQGY